MNNNIKIDALTLSPYGVNTYIVGDDKEVMIIDMPACESDFSMLDKIIGGRKLARIVYTHGHFDHIQGADDARSHYKGVKQYIHEDDASMLTDASDNLTAYFGAPIVYQPIDEVFSNDGQTFDIGSINFTVMHTPGHSSGCVCYYTEGHVFTGDTLFYMGVGRTDLIHSNHRDIEVSIQKIFQLPNDTLFYPGHEKYATSPQGTSDGHLGKQRVSSINSNLLAGD